MTMMEVSKPQRFWKPGEPGDKLVRCHLLDLDSELLSWTTTFLFLVKIFSVVSVLIIEHLIVSRIYIFTGGFDGLLLKDILQYNTAYHTWEKVAEMKEARFEHAVGVLADVSEICP